MKFILIFTFTLSILFSNQTEDVFNKILADQKKNGGGAHQKMHIFKDKRLVILKKLNNNMKDAIDENNIQLLREYNSLEHCLLRTHTLDQLNYCKEEFLGK